MGIGVGLTSKGRTAGATSQATTAGTTQVSGSSFVMGAIWTDTANFSSVQDSKSNTWTQLGSGDTLLTSAKTRWYYCNNGVGGASHTFQFNVSASVGITVVALEITGGALVSILDQFAGRNDNATPFTLASGLTTTQAAELLTTIFFGDSGSGTATHAESGLGGSTIQSAAEETDGVNFWTAALATAIKSSTGTFNPSWTESGGADSTVMLATFKELIASVSAGMRLANIAGPGRHPGQRSFTPITRAYAPTIVAALTGSSFNFSAGALTPNTSLGLAGGLINFSAGTLTPALSAALAGSLVNFSAGTITPNTDIALAGSLIVFNTGTMTVAASDVTVALSGTALAFSTGTLTADLSVALAGTAEAFAAGTLGVTSSIPLVSQLLAFQLGSLGSTGGDPVAPDISGDLIIRARRRWSR